MWPPAICIHKPSCHSNLKIGLVRVAGQACPALYGLLATPHRSLHGEKRNPQESRTLYGPKKDDEWYATIQWCCVGQLDSRHLLLPPQISSEPHDR